MSNRRFYRITIALVADEIWARRRRSDFRFPAAQPFGV